MVFVNKENPVSKLTKDQLKGIFTGKIGTWKEIGGGDLPIIVVWTSAFGGNFLFQKAILDGVAESRDVLVVNTSQDALATIKSNAEGIAIGPLAIVEESVKAVESLEVSRPITLVAKGKPSANVQKLIDYKKADGQNYVGQ
jgi:phosphate transport system substrate-binding protein